MPKFQPGAVIPLDTPPGAPEQVHVLHQDEFNAIQTALDARRSLLISGEPGTGKTQLAAAAAKALNRAFVSHVVDARTESRDLQWHVDAVRRLADAQVAAAISMPAMRNPRKRKRTRTPTQERAHGPLDIRNYVEPRPLWWALNWTSAATQAEAAQVMAPSKPAGWKPANGVVVLIDEIDKGGADVPNGLLEALGSGQFRPPGYPEPIRPDATTAFPLIIITTNDTQVLPDAFTRRCVVLHLTLPDNTKDLIRHLIARGKAHFPKLHPDILRSAAEMVADDRARTKDQRRRPLPGQAEYIDLLRVVQHRVTTTKEDPAAVLARARPFLLLKHQRALPE